MSPNKLETDQRIYTYALSIVRFVKKLPQTYESSVLGKQLLRSGTSITANMIEAKGASSKKDYINFFNYALKSANETKLWLALIRDTNEPLSNEARMLLNETVELANILGASVKTMRNNKNL